MKMRFIEHPRTTSFTKWKIVVRVTPPTSAFVEPDLIVRADTVEPGNYRFYL